MKLAIVLFILCLPLRTASANNNDLQKILARLYRSAAGDSGCCSAAAHVAEIMQSDGGWADINYKVCGLAFLFSYGCS